MLVSSGNGTPVTAKGLCVVVCRVGGFGFGTTTAEVVEAAGVEVMRRAEGAGVGLRAFVGLDRGSDCGLGLGFSSGGFSSGGFVCGGFGHGVDFGAVGGGGGGGGGAAFDVVAVVFGFVGFGACVAVVLVGAGLGAVVGAVVDAVGVGVGRGGQAVAIADAPAITVVAPVAASSTANLGPPAIPLR